MFSYESSILEFILEILRNYFTPQKNVIYESYIFNPVAKNQQKV